MSSMVEINEINIIKLNERLEVVFNKAMSLKSLEESNQEISIVDAKLENDQILIYYNTYSEFKRSNRLNILVLNQDDSVLNFQKKIFTEPKVKRKEVNHQVYKSLNKTFKAIISVSDILNDEDGHMHLLVHINILDQNMNLLKQRKQEF
jgi:hypothetical protein